MCSRVTAKGFEHLFEGYVESPMRNRFRKDSVCPRRKVRATKHLVDGRYDNIVSTSAALHRPPAAVLKRSAPRQGRERGMVGFARFPTGGSREAKEASMTVRCECSVLDTLIPAPVETHRVGVVRYGLAGTRTTVQAVGGGVYVVSVRHCDEHRGGV
jgi:hypothetical protein